MVRKFIGSSAALIFSSVRRFLVWDWCGREEREEFEVVSATLKSARSDWPKKFQIM